MRIFEEALFKKKLGDETKMIHL